jgi:hypothetical protein
MPNLTTPTRANQPGHQMSAASIRVLSLINKAPNSTTRQLATAWADLSATSTVPDSPDSTTPLTTVRTWISKRINRLSTNGHVINNGTCGSDNAIWHLTRKGHRAIGLDPDKFPPMTKPTPDQIASMLAPKGSKVRFGNAPNFPPAATQAAAKSTTAPQQPAPSQPAEAPAKAKATDTAKPSAIDTAKLSPREREIAMFADIHSIVSGKPVPYNGIKSQLGSKGKASLYGPNSTVR